MAILSNSYNVVVSGTVTLQCVVNANPIHTVVQWQKIVNGQITNINLGNDNRLSGSTVNSPSLTISQSQFVDEGNYICTATNPVGTGTSQQTFLDVTGSMYKGTQSQFILFIPSGCLCLCMSLTLYQKLSQLLQHFRFDQIKLDAFYQDAYIIAEFCSTVFEGIVAL